MFNYTVQLHKSKAQSPFLKNIKDFRRLQATIYAEADHLLPDEQWAQITVLLTGTDDSGNDVK